MAPVRHRRAIANTDGCRVFCIGMGDRIEVEITGRIEGVLALLMATRPEGQQRWLGEEDSWHCDPLVVRVPLAA